MRMPNGQYLGSENWKLLNVDQKVVVARGLDDIEGLLREANLRKLPISHAALASASVMSKGVLAKLPQELLDAIIRNIDRYEDIICFALTSSFYWRVLQSLARDSIIKSSAPWAGDRIVHIGEYASSVPPSCPEVTAIAHSKASLMKQSCRYDGYLALVNPLFVLDDEKEPLTHLRQHRKADMLHLHLPPKEYQLYQRLLGLSMQMRLEPGHDVLRNFSLIEYVLSTALARRSDASCLGELGDILLTATTWSDEPSVTISRAGCHGRWAGCRFVIIDEKDFMNKAGWKDVSDEMVGPDRGLHITDGALADR